MKTLALAAACALVAAPVLAQTTAPSGPSAQPPSAASPDTTPSPSPRPSNPSTSGAAAPSAADFATKVAISDMFEIQSSELARQKGDKSEKPFARRMIHDHTQTTAQLKKLVSDGKVQAQLPTALDSEHQQMLDDLKGKTGKDFDRAYNDAQKKGHEDAVALFTAYAQNGDNPALKQWASKTLPHLKEHLRMANELK